MFFLYRECFRLFVSEIYILKINYLVFSKLISIFDVFVCLVFFFVYFKEFSNWIIIRFLRIVVILFCYMLYKKICEVICLLLFFFKSKSFVIFGVLIKELLYFFEDLIYFYGRNVMGYFVEWLVLVNRFLS